MSSGLEEEVSERIYIIIVLFNFLLRIIRA